jgi:uncharacterized protein YkwD
MLKRVIPSAIGVTATLPLLLGGAPATLAVEPVTVSVAKKSCQQWKQLTKVEKKTCKKRPSKKKTPQPAPIVDATMTSERVTVPAPEPVRQTVMPAGWQDAMLNQVNSVRAAAGVNPVTTCAPLQNAAQLYARLMADTGHYGHAGPAGEQAWDRMLSAGYNYQSAGENIAHGQNGAKAVMDAWVASPSHYTNIINPEFTHLGSGGAETPTGRPYWVQNFGSGGTC